MSALFTDEDKILFNTLFSLVERVKDIIDARYDQGHGTYFIAKDQLPSNILSLQELSRDRRVSNRRKNG